MKRDDGRFINPEIGILKGEAAQQRTQAKMVETLGGPSTRLPQEYAASSEGPTYYDQPVLQAPVWIWTVPLYFYLGGTGGGALTLGAAAQAADHGRLSGLIQRCHWIGVTGLTLGTACLIYDLGRPMRFLNMLRVFRPSSPLSVGSWLLATATPLAGLAALFRSRRAGYLAGIMGLPLAGYTGVVLADTAVPAWQEARRVLPVLFIGSAVAGTASILDLVELSDREERAVRVFGLLGKTMEVGGMLALERAASKVERVGRPYRKGRSGFLWKAAKILSAASLVLSLVPPFRSTRKQQVAGVLGTLGAVVSRYAVLEAGKASVSDPRATFELQRRALPAGAPAPQARPKVMTGGPG